VINDNDIARCVRKAIDAYFRDLDGERPCAIHEMVLCSVEKPLIEVVLARVDGNQTQAAALLGLNRNTLRKKMKAYGLK
jgi:Fis family transcriptional regulator